MDHINEAIKWLELFKNKFVDFDNTSQIPDNIRMLVYHYYAKCYTALENNNLIVEYTRKVFNIIQNLQCRYL